MPVEICSRHINCFTELGEVVDPFLGSVRTAIACKLMKEEFGSEINKDIPIIEERLKMKLEQY